jgi:pimeloyl-ACP methyl ester carboxylesterase
MGILPRSLLRLKDGRQLAYTAIGAPAHAAQSTMIYHHGWPSSAQEALVCADTAAAHGLRIIAFDRPGIGSSSYTPGGSRPAATLWGGGVACR